jgi:hypothetical protein
MKIAENEKILKNGIFLAAMFWWISIRPKNWSDEDHIANPTVNLTDDASGHQKKLAQACAKYLRFTNDFTKTN